MHRNLNVKEKYINKKKFHLFYFILSVCGRVKLMNLKEETPIFSACLVRLGVFALGCSVPVLDFNQFFPGNVT